MMLIAAPVSSVEGDALIVHDTTPPPRCKILAAENGSLSMYASPDQCPYN